MSTRRKRLPALSRNQPTSSDGNYSKTRAYKRGHFSRTFFPCRCTTVSKESLYCNIMRVQRVMWYDIIKRIVLYQIISLALFSLMPRIFPWNEILISFRRRKAHSYDAIFMGNWIFYYLLGGVSHGTVTINTKGSWSHNHCWHSQSFRKIWKTNLVVVIRQCTYLSKMKSNMTGHFLMHWIMIWL